MAINFKEGFKRITLTLCILIFIIGVILSYFQSISEVNSIAKDDLKLEKSKGKIVSLKDDMKAENVDLYNYDIFSGNISISYYDNKNDLKFDTINVNKAKKIIQKPLTAYIGTFLITFIFGLFYTVLVSGFTYGIFLLLTWIFSGFIKTKHE